MEELGVDFLKVLYEGGFALSFCVRDLGRLVPSLDQEGKTG